MTGRRRVRLAVSAAIVVGVLDLGSAAVAAATLQGTTGDDSLVGTDDDDVIHGLGGNDTLHGIGGHDQVLGGPGHDLIAGGPGADELYGGAGHDVLCGDGADTVVEGGPGTDLPCITVPDRITTDQDVSVGDRAGYARLLDDNAGDPHTPNVFGVWIPPDHGTITIDATTGRFEYTPEPGFVGTDLFLIALTKTIDPQPTAAEVDDAQSIIFDPAEGYQVIARGRWTEVEVRGVAVSPNPPDGSSPTTSGATSGATPTPPASSGPSGSPTAGTAGSGTSTTHDRNDNDSTDSATPAPTADGSVDPEPTDEESTDEESTDGETTSETAGDPESSTEAADRDDGDGGDGGDGGRSELAIEPNGGAGSTAALPATIVGVGSVAALVGFLFHRRRRAAS